MSLTEITSREYLINIQPANIKEVAKHLVLNDYGILSVIPVSFSSKEFSQQLGKMMVAKKHEEGLLKNKNERKATHSDKAIPDNRPNIGKCLLIMIYWQMKCFCRSAVCWIIPIVIVLLTLLGIFATISVQKELLDQQISTCYLLSNVMTGLYMTGLIMMSIISGVSICKDYSENRLRFLFVLPVKNTEILLSKIVVWSIVTAIYLLLSIHIIGGILCISVSTLLGYPWLLGEVGMSYRFVLAEFTKILPNLFISYFGAGLLCMALGTILKKTIATLSISMLLLITSFIAIPGFRVNILPFTKMVIQAGDILLTMGNGIVPFSTVLSSQDMFYSLIIMSLSVIVSLFAFSKKVW